MNKNFLYIRTKVSFFGEIPFPIIIKPKMFSEIILCLTKSDRRYSKAEQNAQVVKCLSCRPEDLRSDPWTHVETSYGSMYVASAGEGGEGGSSLKLSEAGLAEQMSCSPGSDHASKKEVESS